MRKHLIILLCGLALLMLPVAAACSNTANTTSQPDKLVAHDKEAPSSDLTDTASEQKPKAPQEEATIPDNQAKISGFAPLSQYPELPNGCEVTTLTAVLNYYGVPVSKTTLSDNFLPKAPVGQANFYREFVGDPRNSDAYGCYAPVIVTTADSYLQSAGSALRAQNLTGTPLESLYSYIDQGIPVIVWATQYNQHGHYSVTWYVDGQSLTWFTPEHCMTLVGYDLDAQTVSVADPMQGAIVEFDLLTFISNYNDLGQQAVIIS